MKILAYGLSHDVSWIYYDTEVKKLYMFSAEREYNVKHATIRFKDILFILRNKFQFDPKNNKDHYVIGWQPKMPPLINKDKYPSKNELYKVSDNFIQVDHHYLHILSSLVINDNADFGIAIDGEGDYNRKCMIMDNLHDLSKTRFLVPDENPIIGKLFKLMASKFKFNHTNSTLAESLQDTNQDVGKIMGLQAYGKVNDILYKELSQYSLTKENFSNFEYIFDRELSKIDLNDQKSNFDSVTTIYKFLCDAILSIFKNYAPKNKLIAYSGGCALSTVANDLLLKNNYNIVVCPAANDGGLSLGAIKFADLYFKLSIDFSNIIKIYYNDLEEELLSYENAKKIANLLVKGEIVALVQGSGEVGPRALGWRSLLMNPSIPNGKDVINSKVKHREWWRPFGGSTITTDIIKNYKKSNLDYYMLRNFEIKEEWHESLRSIIHKDGSCRLQIIENKDEPLYKIIEEFYKLTGIPAVLNTSYNLGGKPIPNYHKYVIDTFRNMTNVNFLFYNNRIYIKNKTNEVVEMRS